MPTLSVTALGAVQTLRLREILVQDLYRRALVPLLFFIPILYLLYRALERAIEARPVIAWIFVGMIAVLVPRIACVVLVDRVKKHFPDPRVRVGIFAVSAAMLGCAMAAVNILAAPVVSPEELALIVIVAAGINSIAILSMSPSLLSYLLYMVPNITSVAVAVLIGPPLQYRGTLLFLIVLNLFSLIVMAAYAHFGTRKSILLRLQVDDANETLRDINARLEAEIVERLAAESALRERNGQLETANRQLAEAHSQLLQSEKLASVGQLAAGIAHEINNPLAFVHSNLNTLGRYANDVVALVGAYEACEDDGLDKTEATRNLQQLKKLVQIDFIRDDLPSLCSESSDGLSRVERIVRDLKEFTRVDRGGRQPTDLHQCIEQTLSVAAHELQAKADIAREFGELPLVECVPAQVNQALLNLLLNAAQAMDSRGTITVRTGIDASSAWIAIADTGRGIEAANLGRIFDPFFTTRSVGSGIGLGLSMVYCCAKQHGGRIEADSAPGKGSVFTLRLPLAA